MLKQKMVKSLKLKMIEVEHDGAKQREVLEEVRQRQQCAIN